MMRVLTLALLAIPCLASPGAGGVVVRSNRQLTKVKTKIQVGVEGTCAPPYYEGGKCLKGLLVATSTVTSAGLDGSAYVEFGCLNFNSLWVRHCTDEDCAPSSCASWKALPALRPNTCIDERITFSCPEPRVMSRPTEQSGGSTSLAQHQALYDLFVGTQGLLWTSGETNWLSGDPCDGNWAGISCSDGRVTRLDMVSIGMNGTLPASFVDLVHLSDVDFSWNKDLAGPMPPLPNVQTLKLERTGVRGAMPKLSVNIRQIFLGQSKLSVSLRDFASYKSMEKLHLTGISHLTGKLGDLATASALAELDLSETQLLGFSLAGLELLPKVTLVKLAKTRVEGKIPDVFDQLRVKQLDVSGNYITGGIPASLAASASIHTVHVQNNKMDGVIPRMPKVKSLLAQSNYFSGSELQLCGDNIESADLSDNPLEMELPTDMGGGSSGCKLRSFRCHHCGLHGPLPTSYPSGLEELTLHSNRLSGELPEELGSATELEILDLDGNNLHGGIPASWKKLEHLRELRMRFNQLSGTLSTSITALPKLQILYLEHNRFTGEVNFDEMISSGSSLYSASLNNNDFGSITEITSSKLRIRPESLQKPSPGPDRSGMVILYANPKMGDVDVRPRKFCYEKSEVHNSVWDDILKKEHGFTEMDDCGDDVALSCSYKGWQANLRYAHSFQRGVWFPLTSCMSNKAKFSVQLEAMQKTFPGEFDFYPRTFILPYQYDEFQSEYGKQGDNALWLIKPMNSCCGKGIRLVKPNTITKDVIADTDEHGGWFAQWFVHPPFKFKNQKMVVRIFTILDSFAPLRLSIFNETLLFWTGKYAGDGSVGNDILTYSTDDVRQKDRYITNWFVNNLTPTLFLTFKELKAELERRGKDVPAFWERLRQVVIKSMVAVQTTMARNTRKLTLQHTIGECYIYDIAITEDLEPYVCEVNVDANMAKEVNYNTDLSPHYWEGNYNTSHAGDALEVTDYELKKDLSRDVLRLTGVTPATTESELPNAAAFVTKEVAALNCTTEQAAAAGAENALDMAFPCLTPNDVEWMARLEAKEQRMVGGGMQHGFPCANCLKYLHVMPELHRNDLVGVWWLQQKEHKNTDTRQRFSDWIGSTYLEILAKRINGKFEKQQ